MSAQPGQRLCVVGLGPVGLVTACGLARLGFSVTGVEKDAGKLSRIISGHAPFLEPGMNVLLQQVCADGTFHGTDNLAAAAQRFDIFLLTVGTPTCELSDAPDLSSLETACRTIAESWSIAHAPQPLVVIRSTVQPGTIATRLIPQMETSSGLKHGRDFHLACNPEFLREGKAIKDFFCTLTHRYRRSGYNSTSARGGALPADTWRAYSHRFCFR